MDRTPRIGRALAVALLFAVAGAAPAAESADAKDARALVARAREAAKAGDAEAARALCGEALDASPDSLVVRLDVAQLAESARKDPWLAREHYAEIVNAAERAARLGEKLPPDDAKAAKDAAGRVRVLPDPYSKEMASALKAYFASTMKAARAARGKKHWTFAGNAARTVKNLFAQMEGVVDPKDPLAREADKILNESLAKRSEDRPDVPEALQVETSGAVAELARALSGVSDRALAVFEEVRGPHARRRALAPLGVLVGLRNDPVAHARKADRIWERARALEPAASGRLRFVTDAKRFEVRLNGKVVGASKADRDEHTYADVPVELFRESNAVGFFGKGISMKKEAKGGLAQDLEERVFLLLDVEIGKDHVATDDSWSSALDPPEGWDRCPQAGIDLFPATVLPVQGPWEYEKTKSWAGKTLAGDLGETHLRKLFDLPAGHAIARKPPAPGTPESAPAPDAASRPSSETPEK